MQRSKRLACAAASLALAGGLFLPAALPALAQTDDPNAVPMQNNSFVPPQKTVAIGTTVTWINMDGEAHDVLANDLTFQSPQIDPGATFSYTFTTPGTFSYVCDLHDNMNGEIVVTDGGSSTAAVPPTEGAAAG
jgi:plastocyanin